MKLMSILAASGIAGALAIGSAGSGIGMSSENMVAHTDAKETISARRLVMTSIGNSNDVLHDMFDGHFEYNDREVRGRLDAISTMLLAFPNLYRSEPDAWTAELEAADPTATTSSLPDVWADWEDFYTRAMTASRTAFEASMTTNRDRQKALTDDLEGQCESCHAAYRREMSTMDFDNLLGPVGQ